MKPHEYQAFVLYWKSNREIQQAIADKEKQAKLEKALLEQEKYPCSCYLQDPEQCFEDTPDKNWTIDERKTELCFCPCHRYFESF